MMRWKITWSYLPVAARVAKFLQVCGGVVSGVSVGICWMLWGLVTYSGGLFCEQRNCDVSEGGVHDDALGMVGIFYAR